jgi:hypothetical protein
MLYSHPSKDGKVNNTRIHPEHRLSVSCMTASNSIQPSVCQLVANTKESTVMVLPFVMMLRQ